MLTIERLARNVIAATFKPNAELLAAMAAMATELERLTADRERLAGVADEAMALHASGDDAENVSFDGDEYFSEADHGTWVSAWVRVPNPDEERYEDQDF